MDNTRDIASPSASFEKQKRGKTDHFITFIHFNITKFSNSERIVSVSRVVEAAMSLRKNPSLGDRIVVELIGDSFPKFEESAHPVCPKTFCCYYDGKKTREILGHILPTCPLRKKINQCQFVSRHLTNSRRRGASPMVGYFHRTMSGEKACTTTTCGSMLEHAHVRCGFGRVWTKSSSETRQKYHSRCLAGNSPRFRTFPSNTTVNWGQQNSLSFQKVSDNQVTGKATFLTYKTVATIIPSFSSLTGLTEAS